MDKTESYLYLFSDALFSNLVLSIKSELVLDVMRIFNSYNSLAIIILSVIGSSIASIINVGFGRIIRKVKKTDSLLKDNKNYFYLNDKFNNILPIMLFFSFIPIIGPIMTTIIGLFNIKIKYIKFLYMFVGKIIYYIYKMNLINF